MNSYYNKGSSEDRLSCRTVDIRREFQRLKDTLGEFQAKRNELAKLKIHKPLSQAKQTEIGVESLNKLLRTLRYGPQFFILLYQNPHSMLPVTIPETLLFVPAHVTPVYLYNNELGYIIVDTSERAVQNFHRAVEEKTINYSIGVPKYIHRSFRKNPTICHTWPDATEVFDNCCSYSHYLQTYYISSHKYISKISYHWVNGKPARIYTITSKQQANVTRVGAHRRNTSEKVLSHNLYRTPSLINSRKDPNRLGNTNYRDRNSSHTHYSTGSLTHMTKNFIIDLTDKNKYHVITSSQKNPELQKIVKILAQFISKSLSQEIVVPLEELLLDFIKDPTKHWLFLGCKSHKFRGDKKKPIQNREPITFQNSVIDQPVLRLDLSTSKKKLAYIKLLQNQMKRVKPKNESTNSIKTFMDKVDLNCNTQQKSTLKMRIDTNALKESMVSDYLHLKSSDHLGRIPINMIKLVPESSGNVLIKEIKKCKESVLVPTRHKERFKNLTWSGPEKLPPGQYAELLSRQMDKISKEMEKRRRAMLESRKLPSQIKSAQKLWDDSIN